MSRRSENAPRNKGLGGRWLAIAILFGVCAIAGRAEDDGAAKVLTLNGQVSILRDNSPWVLNVGDSVKPRQIIITGADGFALLQVADGSTFEVFPNSRVIFRDNPGNWKDLLEVFLGRVKVQIQKIGGQPDTLLVAGGSAGLRAAMAREGLEEVRFAFDFEGSKILVQD